MSSSWGFDEKYLFVGNNYKIGYTTELWNEIDSAIQLHDCCVYSYINDLSDDPLSEGQMYLILKGIWNNSWSFNYFFYNKELANSYFKKKFLFAVLNKLSTGSPFLVHFLSSHCVKLNLIWTAKLQTKTIFYFHHLDF